MGKLRQWCEEQGVGPLDFPLFVAAHEVMSVAFAVGWWYACYRASPTRWAGRLAPERVRTWAGKAYSAAEKAAGPAVASWSRRVPALKRADPTRLTASFAESLVVRAALKPVTLPGKLVLSFQCVRLAQAARRRKSGAVAASTTTACMSLAAAVPRRAPPRRAARRAAS